MSGGPRLMTQVQSPADEVSSKVGQQDLVADVSGYH